jgi:GT2 family glycosyltransferase
MMRPSKKIRRQASSDQGKKIVVLGIMSRKPVAGVIWQTLHYLLGFRRLGYEVYYVESHGLATGLLMRLGEEGSATAAAFIDGVMRPFDLGDRWAFHAVHTGGRCYGLSEGELKQLYRSASLIINLHGATQPLPEHSATGRLVYLETDPVLPQIELHNSVQQTIDFLEPHCAFFTFGENYGRPDCKLPVSERFDFRPTRQPVVVDLWQPYGNGAGHAFSTVGSWRQLEREVTFRGEVYHWSKHHEFMKFLDLPGRTDQAFELALNRYDGADKRLLESKGWSVRDALGFSTDMDAYRQYIATSRGEFTVAKDQNVRLRTGWFSDRSATYLAAGRPVVTQETGFSDILPTGQGLFAFTDLEEAVQVLESINSDYERHRRVAFALARDYFSYDVVLTRLLADLGLPSSLATSQPATEAGTGKDSAGVARTAALPEDTGDVRTSMDVAYRSGFRPQCSIIIPVYNRAALTRECLDALLRSPPEASSEIVVVDDASTDATQRLLAGYGGRIRVVKRETNGGFAAACNAGAAAASGEYLVFLNNDVVPKDGWLDALIRYAESHPGAAAVGSKLLYPDGTIQHAGVVVCQDLYPRHLYAGFPADHPAVNKSRRFQIVTAASMLLRREPFEEAGGFDAAFLNGFEDVDLCLRLGERGHEVYYCHESVGYHLEAVSEGRLTSEGENLRLYLERWTKRLRPDDLRYYLDDGLLSLSYARSYPIRLTVSPLLALMDRDERDRQSNRLLNIRSRQAFELLRETIRLTVRVQEAELRATATGQADCQRRTQELTGGDEAAQHGIDTLRQSISEFVERLDASAAGAELRLSSEEELRAMLLEAHELLLRRDGEIEALVHDLQATLAAALQQNIPAGGRGIGATNGSFVPSKYLRYQQLIRRIRDVVRTNLPPEATVVVVSRGDEALLELGDYRRGWHFPQVEGGVYAGCYPADSAEAISHLEELRTRGGEFLLLPETAFWWLDHYGEFREHLEDRYQLLVSEEETCLIFTLRDLETEHRGAPAQASGVRNDTHQDGPA